MKKLLKNLCMCLLAMVVVCASAITLTACKEEQKESQIMSISVNPSIEFIVDENDKVVSVTATNEDCVYILDKFNEFIGMSAQNAALKFLELCEEFGFEVEGLTYGQEITISISGEADEELYNVVKNKIKAKASALGVSIAPLVEIDDDELEEMVAEYYQEYTASEIDNMSEKKLFDLIKKSRKETEELHTPDERQAYYKERAQEILKAKIDAINEYINENPTEVTTEVASLVGKINVAYEGLQSLYSTLNSQIEGFYTNQTTGINKIRETYVAVKNNYLDAFKSYKDAVEQNGANVDELKAQMEGYKETAESYMNELETARSAAINSQMHVLKTTIHNKISDINDLIEDLLTKINLKMSNIQSKINEHIDALKSHHVQNTKNPWESEPPIAS